MGAVTNAARIKYDVPWPHTFALESNPKKLLFDSVQRANISFTENYTQMLALFFFASNLAPKVYAVTLLLLMTYHTWNYQFNVLS